VLKLNALCIKIGVNFQHDHNPVLKLNTWCIKLVSTFNMITTQCWNWIHDASNWCQLSTWSQPSVEIECITKQICFNMINSLNQLHFTSSNINSKQMAESSQKVSIWKAGTWTSPSPWSPCWKACSSSLCNGSSPHGKFKPATDKNRKNILWSCSPKKPNLYSLYYPLVKILQNVGPNELSKGSAP